MIDPVQAPAAVAPSVSIPDAPVSPAPTDVGVIAGAQKAAAPSNSTASDQAAQAAQAAQTAQTAQAAASSGADASQSAPDAAQPLRLLIEHDKATNQYVYKLYDSSGRIVREIPQESLADAQKQAAGTPGAFFDTKV
jgi:uncharacterized FlaG/YvyC family protein